MLWSQSVFSLHEVHTVWFVYKVLTLSRVSKVSQGKCLIISIYFPFRTRAVVNKINRSDSEITLPYITALCKKKRKKNEIPLDVQTVLFYSVAVKAQQRRLRRLLITVDVVFCTLQDAFSVRICKILIKQTENSTGTTT